MSNVLTFNGIEFAKTQKDLTPESKGFFRVLKNGIKLLGLDKDPIAFICTRESCAFVVTAFKFEEQTRYMFSTTQNTEQALGLIGLSSSQKSNACERAVAPFKKQTVLV